MSYIDQEDENIVEDILKRKEFYISNLNDVKEDNIILPKFMLEKMLNKESILRFTSYQTFVKNFINPNSPYNRLLIKWEVGTGKTIAALGIAMNFIEYYGTVEKISGEDSGTVFILGFTPDIFKKEVLRNTFLGNCTNVINLCNNEFAYICTLLQRRVFQVSTCPIIGFQSQQLVQLNQKGSLKGCVQAEFQLKILFVTV